MRTILVRTALAVVASLLAFVLVERVALGLARAHRDCPDRAAGPAPVATSSASPRR